MRKSKRVSTTLTRKRLCLTALIALSLMFTSCEVVRTVTTVAETQKSDKGDVIIQTKTTESYVGSKESN